MADPGNTESSERFLSVPEAAELLRLSRPTLNAWRQKGIGPSYRKFGARVFYSYRDLIAWADACTRKEAP